MKSIIYSTFLVAFLTISCATKALCQDYRDVYLKDCDFIGVKFILIGDKGTTIESDEDGFLRIDIRQLSKFSGETFSLIFTKRFAYLLYRNDLYYKSCPKRKDPHINYNNIKLSEIAKEKVNSFYLIRKELRLDDETEDEGNK
jgi:hypothetical protein